MISFKIKAYSFDSLMQENLACENVQMSAFYNIPSVKDNSSQPVNILCRETSGCLNYTIELVHSPGSTELYLENSQYLSIDAQYKGE